VETIKTVLRYLLIGFSEYWIQYVLLHSWSDGIRMLSFKGYDRNARGLNVISGLSGGVFSRFFRSGKLAIKIGNSYLLL
jgi:hypothetical protein